MPALADLFRPYTALYVGGMGSREQNFYNRLARRMGYEKQAAEIQGLAGALLIQAESREPLQAPVIAVIEMRNGPGGSGTLELAPPQLRWLPDDPTAVPWTARPPAAPLQALIDALSRLPAR